MDAPQAFFLGAAVGQVPLVLILNALIRWARERTPDPAAEYLDYQEGADA